MTIRHAVLVVGAVLVLALAVYLFHEVRSRPAQAQSTPSSAPSRPTVTAAARDTEAADGSAAEGAQAPPAIVRKINPPAGGSAKLNDIRVEDAEDLPPGGAGSAVKLDAIMLEANKAYDRGDFDDAKTIANKVLAKVPGNARMLRILVSVACIDNDPAAAMASYQQLPAPDQAQMRTRCSRYGIDLK